MSDKCTVTSLKDTEIILISQRSKNMYIAYLGSYNAKNLTCISVQDDVIELWHKRLGHGSCFLLNKLVSKHLVHRMSKLKFYKYQGV